MKRRSKAHRISMGYPAGKHQQALRLKMIIKSADDKTKDIEVLQGFLARKDIPAETRKKIEQELRNIRSGIKGESDAAYEINFQYGSAKNFMVIHDLRLDIQGRVAQIDHLVINRLMQIYVMESKRFAEGIGVNEHGEFSAFYNGRPHGVASPLEQNKKHMEVLDLLFRKGLVALPTRLGFQISPKMIGLVLVSKNARISRPKRKFPGLDNIIKVDQLSSHVDKLNEQDKNVFQLAKLVSAETVEEVARGLVKFHKPIAFDWHAKFGIPRDEAKAVTSTTPAPTVAVPVTSKATPTPEAQPSAPAVEAPAAAIADVSTLTADPAPQGSSSAPDVKRLVCAECGKQVTYAVAKFCWQQKRRFGGKVFCMDCQKG